MLYKIFTLLFAVGIVPLSVDAQSQKKVNISGLVASSDSLYLIADVLVSVNSQDFGMRTDSAGYFEIVASPLDTLVFTSTGYRLSQFVLPASLMGGQYVLIEQLTPLGVPEDIEEFFYLPPAQNLVRAFASPEGIDQYQRLDQVDNPNDEERFLSKYPPRQINYGHGRLYNSGGLIPANNFLNPVRWARFIEDVQKYSFDTSEPE